MVANQQPVVVVQHVITPSNPTTPQPSNGSIPAQAPVVAKNPPVVSNALEYSPMLVPKGEEIYVTSQFIIVILFI